MLSIAARAARLICALLLSITGSSIALAASPADYPVTLVQTRDDGALRDRQLYAIDIVCTADRAAESGDNSIFSGPLLNRQFYTATHVLMVTQKPVTDTPALTMLPTDAVALVRPYSTDKAKGYRDLDCDGHTKNTSVIVAGPTFQIVAAASFSTMNEVGPIFGFIRDTLKTLSPIASLFGAGPAAAAISTYVTGIGSVTTPLQAVLTDLNQADTRGLGKTLRAGVYDVTARFSHERLTVRAISSLIDDPAYAFSQFWNAQIAKIMVTLSATNLSTTCLQLKTALTDVGLSAPVDRGYSLLQLGLKAGFVRSQLLDCLPVEEALAVAGLDRDRFWRNADKATQWFTADDVNSHHLQPDLPPPQPVYDVAMMGRLNQLVVALSAEGRSGTRSSSDRSLYAANFADQVELRDKTSSRLFDGDTRTLSRDDFLALLFAKGLHRFGCYDSAAGTSIPQIGDGAVALFLGFLVKADATSAAKTDALVLRPFWNGANPGRIARVDVLNDLGMANARLNNVSYCIDLAIKAPPAPPAPGGTPATTTAPPVS